MRPPKQAWIDAIIRALWRSATLREIADCAVCSIEHVRWRGGRMQLPARRR